MTSELRGQCSRFCRHSGSEEQAAVRELYRLARHAESLADSEFHIESIDGPCKRCARLDELREILRLDTA